jgi:two-component system sensor histidine kinase/response regulator
MFNIKADTTVVNVLMVDDKTENLYSLRSLLDDGEDNINFIQTTSGNEALKIALKEELALILLDVQMPEIDGYEVARLLKLNKKTRDIPIIFVTALNQDTHYVLEGYEKGAVDYLFKPLNPSITKAKVHVFIQMYLQRIELEEHRSALLEVNESLESKVKERTADLTRANEELRKEIERRISAERDLLRSNEKLIKINADLDSFVYTASHDLKMPVSNMEGLLKMLNSRLQEPDDKVKQVLEMLNKSVEQFKTTIHELLHIIKNQKAGKEEVEEINCEEVLDEIKQSIKDVIESSNARFEVDFSNCPDIRLNRQELKSIFYNLLTNAIKYKSPARNPLIRIVVTKNDDEFILSVRDNGLGVDEESKSKMFNMFKRLHSHVEGSGVGLYIVKNIINKYGGSIEVDSEPGNWTEFKIRIPAE